MSDGEYGTGLLKLWAKADNAEVGNDEAQSLPAEQIVILRAMSYEDLLRYFKPDHFKAKGRETGTTFAMEINAFWDSGRRKSGNVRVMVSIHDAARRGFIRPMTEDFIVAPDGTFVGE
jgi:hypothetical protein